jgi:hypothetical protein
MQNLGMEMSKMHLIINHKKIKQENWGGCSHPPWAIWGWPATPIPAITLAGMATLKNLETLWSTLLVFKLWGPN